MLSSVTSGINVQDKHQESGSLTGFTATKDASSFVLVTINNANPVVTLNGSTLTADDQITGQGSVYVIIYNTPIKTGDVIGITGSAPGDWTSFTAN